MRGIGSYNIITRKINIHNPFSFFIELKYHTVDKLYGDIKTFITYNQLEVLYEIVLNTAGLDLRDWKSLVNNDAGYQSERYLNDLEMCLKSLESLKLITCNFRTKFNAHKEVLNMKIVELSLLDKGRAALNDIKMLKKIDYDGILYNALAACSLYVSNTDILSISRDDLIDSFKPILSQVSPVSHFEFDNHIDRGIVYNYFEGKFIISDFKKFKKFVDDNDNFQLEKILHESFTESALRNIELKIVMNALRTNDFQSVYTFIKEDKILDYIEYLTNVEYIKLDYSYNNIGFIQNKLDLKIYTWIITEKGLSYYDNDSVHRTREARYIAADCVKEFKKGSKLKNYKEYFDKFCYMKGLLVFEE